MKTEQSVQKLGHKIQTSVYHSKDTTYENGTECSETSPQNSDAGESPERKKTKKKTHC